MKELLVECRCARCLKKFEDVSPLASVCPHCIELYTKLAVTDEERGLFKDATTEAERDGWFGEGTLPQQQEEFVLLYREELRAEEGSKC